MDRGEEDW